MARVKQYLHIYSLAGFTPRCPSYICLPQKVALHLVKLQTSSWIQFDGKVCCKAHGFETQNRNELLSDILE